MAISVTPTQGIDGIITVAFDQDAIQEDLIYACPADLRISVLSFFLTLDAAGTIKFEDEDDVNLSGTLDVAASTLIGWKGTKESPVFSLAFGKDLQIQTTGGKASGFAKLLLVNQ